MANKGAQHDALKLERRELIALGRITKAIRSIRHGTVTIIIQDGQVVQIDITEKSRIDYSREELLGDGGGI